MRQLKNMKSGGKVSTTGYLPDSPDRFNTFNIIPSDTITMDSVPFDILAVADTGEQKIMKSNSGLHKFLGAKSVKEIPLKQSGGPVADEDYYSANAVLSYYKNQLNDKLKANNPSGFTNYFKGLVDLRRQGNTQGASEYVQNTPYNDYLSPEDVQSTLGEDGYSKYINSLKTVNTHNVRQGLQPLYGNVEGEQDVTKLNYGRRFASMQVTPTYNKTTVAGDKKYSRDYTYDPKAGVTYKENGDPSLSPFKDKRLVMNKRGGLVKAQMGLWDPIPTGQNIQRPVDPNNPQFQQDPNQTLGFMQESPFQVNAIEKRNGEWRNKKEQQSGLWDFLKTYGSEVAQVGMGMLGNFVNRDRRNDYRESKINGLSDSQFVAQTNRDRGDWTTNEGYFRPDQQGYTQFADGGFLGIPEDLSLNVNPMNPTGINIPQMQMAPQGEEMVAAPQRRASYQPSSGIKSDTLTYLTHQQGLGGVNKIIESMESGKPVPTDIYNNMKNNVGKDFYKKYKDLNATSFVNYWTEKFGRKAETYAAKPTPYDNVFQQAAEQTGFTPEFLKTVAAIESGINPNANASKPSQYKGMFQLGKAVQKKYGVTNPFDPTQSILAGASYMADNKSRMKYKEGGTYEVSDEELEQILANGGEVEYL